MTSKQRAYLRGLANTMELILHAGKGGISDAMIKQADDALTARELIKGKVLETAPGTAREIAEDIAAQVNAQVVRWWGALLCCSVRKRRILRLNCLALDRKSFL